MSKNEKINNEAIRMLRSFNVMPEVITAFNNGRIMQSETTFLGSGILYEPDEVVKKEIDSFEKKYSVKVYHVIKSFLDGDEMFSFLYTNGTKTETYEYNGGKLFYAYVFNKTNPIFSEIGSIGVRGVNGGLERIA